MPFLSCFISVVKEKSGELAASLPPDHPILVSACYKSQEGYRFASTALRPFHVILVILNYLSKGHGVGSIAYIIDTPPFLFWCAPFSIILCHMG